MTLATRTDSLVSLSDSDLESSLFGLMRSRRRVTADLLRHLVEVERRKLHLQNACSSLFTYCVEVLHFSEGAAFKHIRGARLARRFPLVLSCIADGSLHLSGLCILGPHLDDDNHVELLAAAAQKSKREIEQLVAERFAKPDVPSRIRKLPCTVPAAAGTSADVARHTRDPGARATGASDTDDRTRSLFPECSHLRSSTGASACDDSNDGARANHGADASSDTGQTVPERCPRGELGEAKRQDALAADRQAPGLSAQGGTAPPAATSRSAIAPLARDRYKVQFTASTQLRDKLLSAQALLRHQIPDGDLAQVIDRAVSLLVEKLEARKFGKTRRPRTQPTAQKPSPQGKRSRYLPAHVRRPVAQRDGARCTYVAPNGKRCSERGRLEFHHEHAFARQGDSVPENLRILCAAHNAYFAELDFGPGYRDRPKPPG